MKNILFLTVITCVLLAGCADTGNNEVIYKECNDTGNTYLCPQDSLCCSGMCVPNSNDNCGACGHACRETEKCVLQATKEWMCACGFTGLPCAETCCSNGCFSTKENIYNCGGCDIKCAAGQACIDGACKCPGNTVFCYNDNTCHDKNSFVSDKKNCGGCGIECPDASNKMLNLKYSDCKKGVCESLCEDGFSNRDGDASNGCETKENTCGNGRIDIGEECDGFIAGDISCGDGYIGTRKCKSDCTIDDSGCKKVGGDPIETQQCSNNIAEGDEICDGTDLKNATCESIMGEGYSGSLKCKSNCSGFDTSECTKLDASKCNNNTLDAGEACDGNSFKDNKTTCQSYDAKYTSGNLKCTSSCTIDTSECAECSENETKCEDDFVLTCKNKTWSKAATACTEGCDKGKCKESGTVSTPTSINCKTLDGFTPAKGSLYTEINTKKLENGATVSIKANWVKSNGVFMNAESYIEVTGLKSVSQITIHYKSNADANGYTVTAGAFSSAESNIASGATGDKTFTVTDSSANSFKIHDIKQKALIVESFSWE